MIKISKRLWLSLILSILCATLLCCAFLLPFNGNKTASAYTTAQLSSATVIDIYDESAKKFVKNDLNTLAKDAGYTDINAMISAASDQGASIAAPLSGKVIQLGQDNNTGGSELKWSPVYLSRSTEGHAILTLWLATDIYASTWSDGTYSTSATKNFNGNTICSNTYDGSFIRHILNGETGWTTGWGAGSNQSGNTKIGVMVSDFYGSGELADYVVTPSKVSWQTSSGRTKNDPGWTGTNSANYPCNWINDNLWLPSVYEVCASTIAANSTASSFTANGGLWGVKTGNICSINSTYSWLRSGSITDPANVYRLNGDGGCNFNAGDAAFGVRPALHLDLTAAAGASITKLTAPSGTVETTYNGSTTGQSVDTITENIPNWYNSIYYTDPSIITVTYKNSTLTSPVSKVVEAGEYTATATLNNTTSFKWSDSATNTSLERTFTFKVKKKELEVEFENKDGVKVAKFKDQTQIYARDKNGDGTPKFTLVTKYSKNGNAGSATYTAPDSTGDWYAHAFITDTDCNYSVSNTGDKFTINKIVKKYPAVTDEDDLNFTYDGNEHTIYISGYDSELMNYTPPTGITMSYDEGTKLLSFKVTDAD